MPDVAEMEQSTTQKDRPAEARQGTGAAQTHATQGTEPAQGAGATTSTPSTAASRSALRTGETGALGRREPRGLGFPRLGELAPWGGLGSPFTLMRQFADEVDRVFEDFLGGGRRQRGGLERTWPGPTQEAWSPQIEVTEREGNLVVCADLPGMKKEDVRVEVREDHLVLEGERRQESEQREGGFYRSERSYGRFYRAIPLPEGVEPEKAQASFRDGVLEVKLPLPERRERSRRIEIG